MAITHLSIIFLLFNYSHKIVLDIFCFSHLHNYLSWCFRVFEEGLGCTHNSWICLDSFLLRIFQITNSYLRMLDIRVFGNGLIRQNNYFIIFVRQIILERLCNVNYVCRIYTCSRIIFLEFFYLNYEISFICVYENLIYN